MISQNNLKVSRLNDDIILLFKLLALFITAYVSCRHKWPNGPRATTAFPCDAAVPEPFRRASHDHSFHLALLLFLQTPRGRHSQERCCVPLELRARGAQRDSYAHNSEAELGMYQLLKPCLTQ